MVITCPPTVGTVRENSTQRGAGKVHIHPPMRPGIQRQKWQTGVYPRAQEGDSVKYRLVTRSDFDGLVCAVLLRHLDMIDDIKFVHPKDMQDGKIPVTERDISTN